MTFCEYDDVVTILQLDDISINTGAAIASSIEDSTAAIRNYTHQYLSFVEDDTLTIDGHGGTKIYLPELPVSKITSVTLSGVTLTEDTDYKLGQHGILHRLNGYWTSGVQNIVIVYSHGYTIIPDDLNAICVRASSRLVQSGIVSAQFDGNPVVSSTSLGDYSVAYNSSGVSSNTSGMMGVSGARILLPSEKSILDKYRVVSL